MKGNYMLIAFITLNVFITEISWNETYISTHGELLIMGDNILRAIKWCVWGWLCYKILKIKI